MQLRVFLALAPALAAACSSDDQAGPDAPAPIDAPADAAIPTTLAMAMPRAVPSDATAILANPKLMPITFANDTHRADIDAFVTAYAASPEWTAGVAEYGIGALTVATPAHLTTTVGAKITDAQVQAILSANLTGASPAWGAPDPNTVYSFFFPTGTIVDDGTGSLCCTDYDGYHYDAQIGGVDVAYAIQCSCPGFDGTNVSDLQQLTVVAAHEAIEAVTDPRPSTFPWGFGQADDDHAAWTYVTGGEVADLCEYADTAYLLTPMHLGYGIQRTWSNAAAAAGHDPCVPEAAAAYYQAIPEQPDAATVSIFGTSVATHGKKIAKGATGTVMLHILADDGSAGPFTIEVGDVSADYLGGAAKLAFVQPTGSYAVGDTVPVQVTVNAIDSNLGGGEAFWIATKSASGPTTYYYALISQ